MHLQHVTCTVALLGCTTLAQNTTLSFNCSSLVPSDTNGNVSHIYTGLSNNTMRISKALLCPFDAKNGDSRCSLKTPPRLNISATTNDTSIQETNLLYPMMYRTFESSGALKSELEQLNTTFLNVAYNGAGQTHHVEPGKAAYLAFRPQMQCANGTVKTLKECAERSEDVWRVREQFEDKQMNICVPKLADRQDDGQGGNTTVAGTVQVVVISEEEAKTEDMQKDPFPSGGSGGETLENQPSRGLQLDVRLMSVFAAVGLVVLEMVL